MLILAVSLMAGVLLWTHRDGRMALSFLVGASAGLVAVQVFRIHVFTILVFAWMLYRGSASNKRAHGRIALMALCVALMAFTSIVGDLVNSSTLALQLIGLAVSAAIIIVSSTPQDRRHMLGGLAAMITVSSLVGILQVVKIVPIEAWHLSVSSLGRPIGLYPEPDWLGMFAGVGALIAWRSPMPKGLRTFAVSVNVAAFVLAFARAAWIAVGIAVVVGILLAWKSKRRESNGAKGRGGALALLAVGAVGVYLFVPVLVQDLATRLGATLQAHADDISAQARVRQIDTLMQLANTAPFYGHGLSASGRVGVWGDLTTGIASENNVASNWLLAMWVDGKYLAIPLILFFVFVTLRSLRTIHGQALLVVLLSSLFSNATFFPVTWLLLALCLAEPSLAKIADQNDPGRALPLVTRRNALQALGAR